MLSEKGYNLALLHPIDFLYSSFYSSQATNLKGIKISHIKSRFLQLKQRYRTEKGIKPKFIPSQQVSSFEYNMLIFIPNGNLSTRYSSCT